MKLANLWRKKKKKSPYGFFGGYSSWEAALNDSTSYTASSIVNGTLKRRADYLSKFNPADCFVDDRNQQFLSAIAYILSQSPMRTIKVLDYGGSWGFYFYVLRRALPQVEFDWTIIETKEMVEVLQPFEESGLRWRSELPSLSNGGDKEFTLCVASGALPYVPEPYRIVDNLVTLGRFLIISRTGFINEVEDKIAVQRVPPEIFVGSYPAWFFSQEKFLAVMQKCAQMRLRWDVPQDSFDFEGKKTAFRGYLFECF